MPQSDAYAGRGRALLERADFDGAVGDLSRAIELDPYASEAYFFRAKALAGGGNHVEALADLDAALRRLPDGAVCAKQARALQAELHRDPGERTGPAGDCDLAAAPEGGFRASVAVLDFQVVQQDIAQEMGMLLADYCREAVRKLGRYILVDRETMAAVLSEEDLGRSLKCDDTRCLVDYGRKLRAQKIVHGRVYRVGNSWFLALKIVDVSSSQTEAIRNCEFQGQVEGMPAMVPGAVCELVKQALGE